MESKLGSLSLGSHGHQSTITSPKATKQKSKPVADSWDAESLSSSSSGSGSEADESTRQSHHGRSGATGAALPIPNAPPPTPIISRPGPDFADWPPSAQLPSRPTGSQNDPDDKRRPEKTTAAASRMIAAGLGVKVPKKTEEEKRYDKAVRDKEIKRKAREKEAREREKEDDERAKASVWGS